MNKYEIRTNKKKNAIVESALELFKEKGFTSTSIKEIAEKAQVSQVSIYNYFGSKEALVIECARVMMKDILEQAMAILDEELSYKEKVTKVLALCKGEVNAKLNAYLSESALKDKNFIELLSDGIEALQIQLYEAFIEEGKKENVINQEIPTEIILKFISSFNDIEITAVDYQKEIDYLHHLYLYGLFGK